MSRATRAHSSRGVSLIEALVALAVMAFGLLGVVGMQATLRYNADISKQRSEAVRMAQEQVEALRSFGALTGYAGIADIATADVSVPTGFGNTTFARTTDVSNPGVSEPQFKTLTVTVEWLDRRTDSSGTQQGVRLATAIAGVSPELSATLGLAGDRSVPQRPLGRHATIPVAAVPVGSFDPSRSRFAPPGSSTRQWIFNNATGQIEKVCDVIPTDVAYTGCTDKPGLLLSGYINFSTGTAPDAVAPSSGIPSGHTLTKFDVVDMTPPPPTPPECFVDATLVPVAYFCLVPTTVSSPKTWSGRSEVNLEVTSTSASAISATLADFAATRYKVCRYTPELTDTPTGGNAAHPLAYSGVGTSLINQNFLVISAGDGTASFGCPGTSTPGVPNYNTYRHQPIS